MNATRTDYTVTIAHEPHFPTAGDCWVARDAEGDWRTYCHVHFAKSAAEAASMMFHACELDFVTDNGATATATILTYQRVIHQRCY